jgi:putative transposase
MESVIGLYKTECLRPGPFLAGPLRTVADVEFATMAWVDWWNNRKLHSSIGNIDDARRSSSGLLIESPHPERWLR